MDPIPKLFRFASPIIVDGIKQERFIIRSDGALGHFYFPPDEKHLLSCEDKTCPGKAMAIYGAEGGEVKLKKKHKKNCLGRSTDFDSSMISSVVHGVRGRADWAINHVRMMPDELKSKIRIHINTNLESFSVMDIVAIGDGPPAGERNTEFHGTYLENVPNIILHDFDTNHEPINFQRFGRGTYASPCFDPCATFSGLDVGDVGIVLIVASSLQFREGITRYTGELGYLHKGYYWIGDLRYSTLPAHKFGPGSGQADIEQTLCTDATLFPVIGAVIVQLLLPNMDMSDSDGENENNEKNEQEDDSDVAGPSKKMSKNK